uniref:Uncharacterized protein n=1 Tax=Micrurus corallinus TaxID=54390 RepID=A0A2D4GIY6_MICCO
MAAVVEDGLKKTNPALPQGQLKQTAADLKEEKKMPGIAGFWWNAFPISPFPRQLPFPGPSYCALPRSNTHPPHPQKGHFQHILSTSDHIITPGDSQWFLSGFLPTFSPFVPVNAHPSLTFS